MTLKEKYWRYSLVAIILLSGLVILNETRPFLGGILGASTIYVLMRQQLFFLVEKKKFRPSVAAVLLLLEAIAVFLIPISLAVWLVVNKVQTADFDVAAIIKSIEHVAGLVEERIGINLLDKGNLNSLMLSLPRIGQSLMGSIGSFGINLVVLVLVLYFMLIGGRGMEKYVYEILPFDTKNRPMIVREIEMIVKSNAIGIPLLAIAQGLIALVGYLIFDAPSPIILAFFTCIATVIPVVGTMLIWLPLCLYLLLIGDWGNAIGMFLYSVIIITNIDNLLRFILQKKMADIHPLITIFGVVIGFAIFGFIGVIFGPLLLSLFIFSFNIFKREYLDK